jgi:hypothetical protein
MWGGERIANGGKRGGIGDEGNEESRYEMTGVTKI